MRRAGQLSYLRAHARVVQAFSGPMARRGLLSQRPKTRFCYNATACGRCSILSAGVSPGVFGSSRPRSPAGSVVGELDDKHWDGSR